MHTHKKLTLGLLFGLTLLLFGSLGHKALAAPSNPQPPSFYWNSCEEDTGNNNVGGTNCTFFSAGNYNPSQLYGKGAYELQSFAGSILFNVPYSADGYNTKTSVIPRVTLIDATTLKPIGNSLSDADFTCSPTLRTAPLSKDVYQVCTPQNGENFSLLIGSQTSGPPLVIALVNNQIQDDPQGDNRGTVYAYEINQLATMSTPTGAPIPPTPTTAPDKGSISDCIASSKIDPLAWIMCPVLYTLDGIIGSLYNGIQDRLCFNTGNAAAYATAGNTKCPGDPLLTDKNGKDNGIQKAWSSFRVIATSILVIAMLAMVISQALGSGLFDAYSVKKMLPKLIAAAILIQLSYPLAVFAINVSNDIGRGIGQLMGQPFSLNPSPEKELLALLAKAGGGSIATTGVLFIALIAAGIFSGLALGGLLLLAIAVVIAVIVGFFILFLREILIIICVVSLPIALVAWVLPGTERYWKMWREMFTKLLMMFPMIVALIVGGEIFASIASGSGGIFGGLAILIGFFGPLIVLPKTFSWGGSAMNALGGAVMKGTQQIRSKPTQMAMSGAEANRKERGYARARRLADNPDNRSLRDQLFAGRWNIAKSGASRERAYEDAIAEGRKVAQDSVQRSLLAAGVERLAHGPVRRADGSVIKRGEAGYVDNKLDAYTEWLSGNEYAGINAKGNEALQSHAFDELARLGDPDRIRRARKSNTATPAVFAAGLAKNFARMNEIAPDFTLNPDLSTVAPEKMVTWDEDTVAEWERQGREHVVMDRATGQDQRVTDPEEIAKMDGRRMAQARAIQANYQAYDRLGDGVRRRVDNAASGGGTGVQIRRDNRGGVPTIVLPAPELIAADSADGETSRASLTSALADTEGGKNSQGTQVASTLGAQMANTGGALNDVQTGHLHTYVDQLAANAGVSEEARRIHTSVVTSYHAAEDAKVTELERTMIAQGHSPAEIERDLGAARATAEAAKARHSIIPSATATPPPTGSTIVTPGNSDYRPPNSSQLPK